MQSTKEEKLDVRRTWSTRTYSKPVVESSDNAFQSPCGRAYGLNTCCVQLCQLSFRVRRYQEASKAAEILSTIGHRHPMKTNCPSSNEPIVSSIRLRHVVTEGMQSELYYAIRKGFDSTARRPCVASNSCVESHQEESHHF